MPAVLSSDRGSARSSGVGDLDVVDRAADVVAAPPPTIPPLASPIARSVHARAPRCRRRATTTSSPIPARRSGTPPAVAGVQQDRWERAAAVRVDREGRWPRRRTGAPVRLHRVKAGHPSPVARVVAVVDEDHVSGGGVGGGLGRRERLLNGVVRGTVAARGLVVLDVPRLCPVIAIVTRPVSVPGVGPGPVAFWSLTV